MSGADTCLVLGASGQVAQELQTMLARFGFAPALVGRETADLTRIEPDVLLDQYSPHAVINAAAYTAVDKAETEREAAFALNAEMPGRFATAAAGRGIPFVQISTDYVFDGSKPAPYVETDPKRPLGAYGESKAAGEEAVIEAGGRFAILRTAWVYGRYGANFLKTMRRLAQTRDELGVVNDQVGSPTRSAEVAQGAARVARALMDRGDGAMGVLHCAGEGEASWADFASAIFEEEVRYGGRGAKVRRITTADYPTPAARPANSRLDSALMMETIGWRPGPWRAQLASLYAEGPFPL
ncbi:MAG: dTDP-4-dehydrorhamnose reductase [Caulobacteraceae bacterium]